MAGNLEFGIRIGGDARGAVDAANRAKQAVDGVGTSAGKAATDAKKLSGSLEDVVRAGAGLYVIRQAIDGIAGLTRIADEFSTVASRISLVTTNSQQSALVQQRLFTIAQSSRVAYTGLAETYARMATATKDLGVSQDRLLGVTRTISQAMTIGGGSADSMRAALVQLSQGLASGTLRGEELNSILEQTPRLAQAIAEGMGVGVGELRKLGEQGRITSSAIVEALEKTAPKIAAEFAQIAPTVSSAFTTVRDAVGLVVSEFDKGTGASRSLATGMTSVAQTLTSIAGSAREAGETLRPVLDVAAWAAFGAASSVALGGIITLLTRLRGLAFNPISIAITVGAATVGGVQALGSALAESEAGASSSVTRARQALLVNQEAQRRLRAERGRRTFDGRSTAGTDEDLAALLQREIELTERLAAAERKLKEIRDANDPNAKERAATTRHRQSELEESYDYIEAQKGLEAAVRSADKAYAEATKGVETRASIEREYQADLKNTRDAYYSLVTAMINAGASQERLNAIAKDQDAVEAKLAAERDKKIASLTKNTDAAQALASAFDMQARAAAELENGTQSLNAAELALLKLQNDPKWKTYGETVQEQIKFALNSAAADFKAGDARKRLLDITMQAAQRDAALWEDGSLGGNITANAAEYEKLNKQQQERVQREREANELLEFRLSLIGMEEGAAERLLVKKRYEIQIEQARRAFQYDEAAWLEERLDIELEILDANREQNRVKQQNAGAEASYRSMLDEQRRAAEQLNSQITDALMRAFESGKDGAKAFRDTLKNMFATLVLRPGLQFIVSSGAQALGGLGIPGLGGGAGIPGLGGLGQGAGMLGSLFGGSSASLSALFAETAGNAALGLGMSGSTALGIAGAAGSIGMAIPYVGLALMAASALGAFDRGGPKQGGFAQTRGMGLTPFFTETQGNKSLQQIVNATGASYQGITRAFGVDPGNFEFALGYDVDPEGDAGARISAGASVNGQSVMRQRIAEQVGEDQAAIEAAIADVTGEALRGAILNSGIPEAARTLLESFDGTTEEFEAYAIKIAGVNALLETTNVGLQQILSGLDLSQLEEFSDLFGGVGQAIDGLSFYVSQFYSEAEQAAIQTETLQGEFARLNQALPESRIGFRELLEGIDLTTEAGRQLYATLIQLAPSVDAYFDRMEEGTEALATAAEEFRDNATALAYDEYWTEYRRVSEERRRLLEKEQDEAAKSRASLRDFLGSLLTSGISPLNPQQQLDIAAQQYRAAVASKTGVESATQNYLDLARRFNPIDFNSVFLGAVRDLGVLGTEPGQSVPQTLQEVVAMLARNVQATAAGSDNVVNAINTQGRGLTTALEAWNRVTQRL